MVFTVFLWVIWIVKEEKDPNTCLITLQALSVLSEATSVMHIILQELKHYYRYTVQKLLHSFLTITPLLTFTSVNVLPAHTKLISTSHVGNKEFPSVGQPTQRFLPGWNKLLGKADVCTRVNNSQKGRLIPSRGSMLCYLVSPQLPGMLFKYFSWLDILLFFLCKAAWAISCPSIPQEASTRHAGKLPYAHWQHFLEEAVLA